MEVTLVPDLLVVGAGPAGMTAAIAAAERGARVLLCEQLAKPGRKLLASGGGRCNLTNTLGSEEQLARFGKQGRFAREILTEHDSRWLRRFMSALGVETHAPDGMRVFPTTHRAVTVLDALRARLDALQVELRVDCQVTGLWREADELRGIETSDGRIQAAAVVVATGGKSYPELGATGSGYALAAAAGHQLADPYPAMVPLLTSERWPARCTAHTMPKTTVFIDLPRHRALRATGDLIFTRQGLAGPVILDLSRELPPLLEQHGAVPLVLELTGGRGQEGWRETLTRWRAGQAGTPVSSALARELPAPLAEVMCELAEVPAGCRLGELRRGAQARLAELLARTPIEVRGTEGFDRAMVTRGGVQLGQVDPSTLESRLLPSLYFCGEVLDLDGPCGGYNLQWAFASGWRAGQLGCL